MKIVNDTDVRYPLKLYGVNTGSCVEFENVIHQKHERDAKFLVLYVPTEYIREDKRQKDGEFRIMVANLDTGSVSLVTCDRMVRLVDAEVVLL